MGKVHDQLKNSPPPEEVPREAETETEAEEDEALSEVERGVPFKLPVDLTKPEYRCVVMRM